MELLTGDNGKHQPLLPDAAEGTTRQPRNHALIDRIPRNRDRYGNRLPWSFYYGIPVVEELPLDETPLADALSGIAEKAPETAAVLHHYYDHRLLPARRRAQDVRREEEEKLAQYNTDALQENSTLDQQKEQLTKQYENQFSPIRAELATAEGELYQAHHSAAQAVAQTGVVYKPEQLQQTVDELHARHQRRMAAVSQLPWTPTDGDAVFTKTTELVLEGLIGSVIGISVGIIAKWVYPDTLMQKPAIILLCVAIGIAAAMLAGRGIYLAYKHAAEAIYLNIPRKTIAVYLGTACFVGVLILFVDGIVEQNGLLAAMKLQAMTQQLSGNGQSTPHSANQLVYFFTAIILTVGYVVYHAYAGFTRGRRDVVTNAIIEKSYSFREGEITGAVCRALETIANVKVCQTRCATIQGAIDQLTSNMHQRQSLIEAQRKPILNELGELAAKRIQDALDDLQGAQDMFDKQLSAALRLTQMTVIRPSSPTIYRPRKPSRISFWQRVMNWLRTR